MDIGGVKILKDEPVVLLLGRDSYALETAKFYKDLCIKGNEPLEVIQALDEIIEKFEEFHRRKAN